MQNIDIYSEQWLFAHLEYANLLDEGKEEAKANQIRETVLKIAPMEIDACFEVVKRFSPFTPHYEVDFNRLRCEQALLCYGSVVPKLAKNMLANGKTTKAKNLYLSCLEYLRDVAKISMDLDGRRRTFDTVAKVFSSFHAELSKLLMQLGDVGGAIYHIEEALRTRRSAFPEAGEILGKIVEKCGSDGIEGLRAAVENYIGYEIPPMEFPITRFCLVKNSRRWFSALRKTLDSPPTHCKEKVLVVAFNLHHLQLLLAVSCILLSRGKFVDFVFLPSLRHSREVSPEPSYEIWEEKFLAEELKRVSDINPFQQLQFFDLRFELPADISPELIEDCAVNARVDLINMTTRTEIGTNEELLKFERNRYALNLDAAQRAKTLMDRRNYARAVIFNGGVMEYGSVFNVARAKDIPVITFETSAHKPGNLTLAYNRQFGVMDTDALWSSDAPHLIDEGRELRISEWAVSRCGRAQLKGPRGLCRLDSVESRVFAKELGFDPDKPIVCLTPNLTWDTAVIGKDTIFSSVKDWVISTIEFFERYPEYQLAIRVHPHEELWSEEFLGEFVRERWTDLPQNVCLVEASEPISSYNLLDISQLVLVYSGTLGIEAAAYGMHVIIAGLPHYAGRGFTREPKTKAAYFDMIYKILDDPESTKITGRAIELARCYVDVYWNHIPQPFPWKYDDFLSSMENDWSMEEVLSGKGEAKFGCTFDYLSGKVMVEEGVIGNTPLDKTKD